MFGWLKRQKKYVGQVCGHDATLEGEISTHDGKKIKFNQKAKSGSVDYCISCLSKMSIRCAWCGESIIVGEPITLYTPRDEFKIPEYAVKYRDRPEDSLRLVGCLRWDCAETGADRSGFWYPSGLNNCKGRVYRVMSPFEAALSGCEQVFVGDLGSIKEAQKIQKKVTGK